MQMFTVLPLEKLLGLTVVLLKPEEDKIWPLEKYGVKLFLFHF